MKLRRWMGIITASVLAAVLLAACTLPMPVDSPVSPAVSTPGVTEEAAPVEDVSSVATGEVATGEEATMSLVGDWDGTISIMGTQLGFIAHFSEDNGELTGTLDIPQQGARGIPLHSISFNAPSVQFAILSGPQQAEFDGQLVEDAVEGTFSQSGFEGTFRMQIMAEPAQDTAQDTDTEAKPDLPYSEEEVTFGHGDVTLAGTLTLPEGDGPHPALILVTGSGQQNRDEEIYLAPGYRPFAVIADTLARQGIAVLRYDDRGIGGSTGDVESATTADFAEDAESGLNYLLEREEIDPAQIGIFGHSEGGLIATMLTAQNPNLSFMILMAGPGLSGYDVVLEQAVMLAADTGISAEEVELVRTRQTQVLDTVVSNEGWDELKAMLIEATVEQLTQLPDAQKAQFGDLDAYAAQVITSQMAALQSPWYRFFIAYDPGEDLAQIDVPVLAIFGGLDLQVPAEANAEAVSAALETAGNEDVTVEIISNANHLFQAAESGGVDEYSQLAPEFVTGFLDIISEWLLERVTLAE